MPRTTGSGSTSTVAGVPRSTRSTSSTRQSRSTAQNGKLPGGWPPPRRLHTCRGMRSTSGPPVPRRGCPRTAPRTGYARSTATSHGTTSCARRRSVTAARRCTPTRRTIRGCSSDEPLHRNSAALRNSLAACRWPRDSVLGGDLASRLVRDRLAVLALDLPVVVAADVEDVFALTAVHGAAAVPDADRVLARAAEHDAAAVAPVHPVGAGTGVDPVALARSVARGLVIAPEHVVPGESVELVVAVSAEQLVVAVAARIGSVPVGVVDVGLGLDRGPVLVAGLGGSRGSD